MKSRIDHEKCRALRAKGWTLTALAAQYGVTPQRMQQVCKGVVCPGNHRAKNAVQARLARSTVSRQRAAEAQKLLARGYAPKVIAWHLKIAPSTVYNYLPTLYLSLGRRRYRPSEVVSQPCA